MGFVYYCGYLCIPGAFCVLFVAAFFTLFFGVLWFQVLKCWFMLFSIRLVWVEVLASWRQNPLGLTPNT